MRTLLVALEHVEGAHQLRVPLEDLLPGEATGTAGGERLGALFEWHFDLGYDAALADRVAVGGQPLGDPEQDG
jgi:hypothetical protein